MCRVVTCFELDERENAALDMLAKLRATADDVKVRIYTLALYRLDVRLMDWQPVLDAMTGARKPEQVRRNKRFPTEKQIAKAVRRWSRYDGAAYLSHDIAERALMNNGMLTTAPLSSRQIAALNNAWNVERCYVLNDYGRAFMAWLDARQDDEHAALDVLNQERIAAQYDARLWMAGVG